jgi:hypothetical protein
MIGSIPMIHQNVITAIKLNILVKRMAYMITLKPAHIIEHTHISGIDYQSKLRLVIKAVFCSIPCTCCMKYKGIAVFRHISGTRVKGEYGIAFASTYKPISPNFKIYFKETIPIMLVKPFSSNAL